MVLERRNSYKRFREDITPPRPSKRSNSPRSSISFSSIFNSPPSTPKKKVIEPPRQKLITSFKNVFKSQKKFLASPVYTDDGFTSPTLSLSPTISNTELSQKYPSPKSPILDLQNLSFVENQSHQIFSIPEIVHKIIEYIDQFTVFPQEEEPIRRRPLSFEHALLIYKNEETASKVWNEANSNEVLHPSTTLKMANSLHNCLLVNKLWSEITIDLISKKLFFTKESKWSEFISNVLEKKTLTRSKSNTKLFIMHKITKARQQDLEFVSKKISGQLEWIELYACPMILPTLSMFSGSNLKKLVLPGSKVVNDEFLINASRLCPRLERLDLRQCLQVSDRSIYHISKNCPNITSINLGRHKNSNLITDKSLYYISQNLSKIETLGLAGCAISDRGLWQIALRNSYTIQRLSLNNCVLLTNASISRIFKNGYFSNISVLEIRYINGLTDMLPLVKFKRLKYSKGKNVMIEGCELIEARMREEEWRFDMINSSTILNEISKWTNDLNDGDTNFAESSINL
ncbi:hypothetical protein WICMUC_003506 [Wickerhamomyces mucosus]|uniref:Antagonist of mitotic exit network protein 1 n=1 Tax=Wickerhamomyces mucosus TaxID=1378264 RepID=A0A9P8PLD0_9ASCO|nr:hypothetical protein WICMUC_003506 [Wickerhamomyces mucosus]